MKDNREQAVPYPAFGMIISSKLSADPGCLAGPDGATGPRAPQHH